MTTGKNNTSSDNFYEDITDDTPEQLEAILEVLSNQMRRDIIKSLAREDNYMAALADEVGSTAQALVKHLKILKDMNIIREQVGTSDEFLMVRSSVKDDKKIKYYTLNKNINLRINFGMGYYEISGNSWDTEKLKSEREISREKYKELLNEFAGLEGYIQSQLNDSIAIDDSLGKMNELLDKFGELEKFLLVERQLIMIRKLKQAVNILTGEEVKNLRPIFFELLHVLDSNDERFAEFEERVRKLLPAPKAEKTLKLLERHL